MTRQNVTRPIVTRQHVAEPILQYVLENVLIFLQLILLASIGFLGEWKKLLRETSAFCAHIFYFAILRISYVDKKSRKFPFFRAKVRNFRETKNAKISH